jgi:hypothetical protein
MYGFIVIKKNLKGEARGFDPGTFPNQMPN